MKMRGTTGTICTLFFSLAAAVPFSSTNATTLPSAVSPAVGLFHIPVDPGMNFIAPPVLSFSYTGCKVVGTTSNSLSVTNTASWSPNQFGPRDGFTQYFVIVVQSTMGTSHEGDWWPVVSNTANSITVDTRSEDLGTLLQPGDAVEVRHLTSLQDLFKSGSDYVLNKDSNGIPSANEEDLIRFLNATGASGFVFYHDGSAVPQGYYMNGLGPYDGSTLTILPDQSIVLFRKSGSPYLEITSRGRAQTTRFTHYLQPGRNILANPFADKCPISTCGLIEAGWIADTNGIPSTAEEDVLRLLSGSGMSALIFYHDGTLVPAGWYMNGVLSNDLTIGAGQGFAVYILGTSEFVWNQPPPYGP
jgi:uncharacterized protein (TIGR02597 family)